MRHRIVSIRKVRCSSNSSLLEMLSTSTIMRHSRLFCRFIARHRSPFSRIYSDQCLNPRFQQPRTISSYSNPSSNIFKDPDLISNNRWNLDVFRGFTSSAEEVKAVPTGRVSAIVDEISGLTLLEVSDLTELLRKKLNIEEMPVMAVMMPGMGLGMKGRGGSGAAGKAEEKKAAEKTAFDLKLEGGYDAGAKIKIIKEVRALTGLGLKEAKDLVEKAPTLLKKGVAKDEAEKVIEKMKEVGAKVIME